MITFFKRNKLPNNAPKFLIIGTQKGGTSAIHHYLSFHPSLIAPKKELKFFNCIENYSKGYDYYHSLMPEIKQQDQYTFETSPGYLANADAYRRIYEYNKNIKMIAFLRNPIERVFSAWNMYIPRYINNKNWFMEWLSACDRKKANSSCIRRNVDKFVNFEYVIKEEIEFLKNYSGTDKSIESPMLMQGLYYKHIQKYLSLFNKKQFLFIESDFFKYHTLEVLKIIENFVQINENTWDKSLVKPFFEGEYSGRKISTECYNLLLDFYKEDSTLLKDMLGDDYDWFKNV